MVVQEFMVVTGWIIVQVVDRKLVVNIVFLQMSKVVVNTDGKI